MCVHDGTALDQLHVQFSFVPKSVFFLIFFYLATPQF